MRSARGIADAKAGVKMTDNEGVVFRDRSNVEAIAMHGSDLIGRPVLTVRERKMTEFPWKGTIMVATNGYERGAFAEFAKRVLDPFTLVGARSRSVHKIA